MVLNTCNTSVLFCDTQSVREVRDSNPGSVKSAQCRQLLATAAMFLRSRVAQALSRGDGPHNSLHTLAKCREYDEDKILNISLAFFSINFEASHGFTPSLSNGSLFLMQSAFRLINRFFLTLLLKTGAKFFEKTILITLSVNFFLNFGLLLLFSRFMQLKMDVYVNKNPKCGVFLFR